MWTMAMGRNVGEGERGWHWLQPTPVDLHLIPHSFLCLPLSSAGSFIPFPAPPGPGWLPPEMVALWPLRFRERPSVCGRKFQQGVYCRDPWWL